MSSATAADTFQIPIRLLREAVKLGLTLAGEDTRDFDNKTLKLVSPRFLSLVPEENDTDFVNLFSPSLFSLHDEGTGMEALLSLPQIIGRLNNRDQQQWMDFVMEASGVSANYGNVRKKNANLSLFSYIFGSQCDFLQTFFVTLGVRCGRKDCQS